MLVFWSSLTVKQIIQAGYATGIKVPHGDNLRKFMFSKTIIFFNFLLVFYPLFSSNFNYSFCGWFWSMNAMRIYFFVLYQFVTFYQPHLVNLIAFRGQAFYSKIFFLIFDFYYKIDGMEISNLTQPYISNIVCRSLNQ